ncbi:transcription factor 21 [Caerostris extrusa]|uniref:Transcription factor 21 n=1 Tax=Caerostris extrusa TaxID=172846 RepID=A0AAV4Q326_CAEEX|nr:transcription factor 21 [Caerostris extrusa]
MAKRRRHPSPPSQEDSTDLDSLFFPTSDTSNPEKPVQRNACANARERARMRVLSRAFSRLKTSLPWVPPDTKLSKLDTLRLAATYIAHLRKILKEDSDGKKTVHPLTFVGGAEQEEQLVPFRAQLTCVGVEVIFAVAVLTVFPPGQTWPFTINNRTGCEEDSTALSNLETRARMDTRDPQSVYENYAPCEYMTINYSEQPRRELFNHYPH